MSKRLNILSATLFSAAMALPALAQDTPTADTVVATVNGTEITLGHMISARETLPEQFKQLPNDVLFEGILNQLVQQTALVQAGDGIKTTRVRIALENEERALIAAQVADAAAAEEMTEDAIKAAYNAKYADADLGREFNASHILVESEDEAKTIIQELTDGADFAEVAKAKSTGPSGPNGGNLGWFGVGSMVKPFEDAVVAMEVGAISAPVQTQFGWHVIKLNEARQVDAPPLEAVRQDIEDELRVQILTARVNQLVQAATVEKMIDGMDPNLLTDTSLLEE